jgi:toxin ParE1/3/4
LAPSYYRFWSLSRFPYILVYDTRVRPARIARVVHMARDLGPLLADLSGETDPGPMS